MIVSSNSCVCKSATKTFWIVTLENTANSTLACGNDNEIAINLETQDYEALGFCQPPVMDQYYTTGLRLPDSAANNRGKCNDSRSYFWRNNIHKEIECVDGLPLKLPRNFDGNQRCNLASVLPGSMGQIFNAKWTRCNSVQYSICQLETNASDFKLCNNVSTTATTDLSNSSTAIIIGSVLGVFVVLVLSCLLHFFCKKNNAKKKRIW